MARLYNVSADTSEKEKIIGGVLTFAQGAWLVGGIAIFASLFLTLVSILPASVALFIAAPPGIAFGCVFAFYKKEHLTFFNYLIYKQAFQKKSKKLINTAHPKYTKDDTILFN